MQSGWLTVTVRFVQQFALKLNFKPQLTLHERHWMTALFACVAQSTLLRSPNRSLTKLIGKKAKLRLLLPNS